MKEKPQSAQDMRKKKKRKRLAIAITLSATLFVCSVVLGVLYIDNRTVEYECIRVEHGNSAHREIKIAHLSDLHFDNVKVDMQAVLERLMQESLDFIAITGDLIDNAAGMKSGNMFQFLESLTTIAPVYYVEGNHEVRSHAGIDFDAELSKCGITVLRNTNARLFVRGIHLNIVGLGDNADYFAEYAGLPTQDYTVLLAHRPEKFSAYSKAEHLIRPNLVLSGHAHGGQFRIFGQGVLSPGQGLFPKYDSGLYQSDDGAVHMVVSRGIGNSLFPFRFNNNPHIPLITVSVP